MRRKRRGAASRALSIAIALGTLTAGCAGSGATPHIVNAFPQEDERAAVVAYLDAYRAVAGEKQSSGDLLGELALLEELRREHGASAGVRSLNAQQTGTLWSFLGDPDEAMRWFDDDTLARAPFAAPAATRPAGSVFVPAADAIVRLARDERAVFLNEAHHIAQHRLLTLELVERLRPLGYRYLALETLSDADSLLNQRGYPLRSTGYYTNEPVFGHVVRRALELGWILVPYEAAGTASPADRELGQARNLVERIFDRDPEARVLVHAGYAHVHESGLLAGSPPMAIRFRELSGIDPLTIDQTIMTAHRHADAEHPLYRSAVTELRAGGSLVSEGQGGELWSLEPGRYDITVFHPRTEPVRGRAGWLAMGGRRRAVSLAMDVCAGEARCIVEARLAGESDEAVPVDRVLARSGEASVLMLPTGRYVVRAVAAGPTELRRYEVSVDS